ncbi:hypothetical protein J6590_015684 [Homalodisca vitripennis]|nr:hypothetical protein J6590_015684 [Homalodisca vitripennis]
MWVSISKAFNSILGNAMVVAYNLSLLGSKPVTGQEIPCGPRSDVRSSLLIMWSGGEVASSDCEPAPFHYLSPPCQPLFPLSTSRRPLGNSRPYFVITCPIEHSCHFFLKSIQL